MPRQTYTGVGLDPFIRYAYTQQCTKREEEGENGKHKNERGKRKFFPRSRNDSSCRPMYAQRIFAGHTSRTRRTHSKTLSFLPPLILNLWRTFLFSSPARTASPFVFSLSLFVEEGLPFFFYSLYSLSFMFGSLRVSRQRCARVAYANWFFADSRRVSFFIGPGTKLRPLLSPHAPICVASSPTSSCTGLLVLPSAFGDVLFRDRENNFSSYTFPFNKFIN